MRWHLLAWRPHRELLSAVACPFLFDLSSSIAASEKQNHYSKTSSFMKEQHAQSKEAVLWRRARPLALQQMPGSDQRATVVITEGLIADRTFQQPVVKWKERRGGAPQAHNRGSADDFFLGACMPLSFIQAFLKSCQKNKTFLPFHFSQFLTHSGENKF